jgi:site-specific DNA-methyltransferase (adenine-specific)
MDPNSKTSPDDYGDVGSAARFFYQAKASAWEREAGLHDRAQRNVNDGRNTPINNPFQRGETQRLNVHPTVKPIRLAEYLARLILPPELDEPRRLLIPFAGSGSEMIGALLAGWDVVTGIEREAEYAELARARVGWWAQFATYDEARAADEKARRAKPAPIPLPVPVVVEDEKPAQMALFEEESA